LNIRAKQKTRKVHRTALHGTTQHCSRQEYGCLALIQWEEQLARSSACMESVNLSVPISRKPSGISKNFSQFVVLFWRVLPEFIIRFWRPRYRTLAKN